MADVWIGGGGVFFGSKIAPSPLPNRVPEGAPGPLRPPARSGWVRLRTIDKQLDLTVRQDVDAAGLTPQLPRIEQVEVPFRAARTWWAGQTAGELSLPVMFDGFPTQSVEPDLRILEAMTRPVSAGKASGMPSPVQLAGNVPGADRLWVITGAEPGEAIWQSGYRVRQYVNLMLTQWLPLEAADTSGRKNPRTSSGARVRRKPVTVKRGDTLVTIALRQLGEAKRWKDIAKANKVKGKARRSPNDLKVGEKLKMPQG